MSSCTWEKDKKIIPTAGCPGCPTYPIAGPAVAIELERLDTAEFPATIEWIQRLDKHAGQHEQLEQM